MKAHTKITRTTHTASVCHENGGKKEKMCEKAKKSVCVSIVLNKRLLFKKKKNAKSVFGFLGFFLLMEL